MRKFDGITNIRLFGLLAMGLMCIGFVIHQLPAIWVFKSSLTPIHGTIRSANLYTITVTDRNGYNRQVLELIFYLNECEKKFYLAQNLDDNYTNVDYNIILRGLNRSESVTVWIKKGELNDYEPKIFQIDKDNKSTLLYLEKVKTERRLITAFLLIMGLGSIGFVLWMKYPEKFKKIFSD